MKKSQHTVIASLLIIAVICCVFFTMMPRFVSSDDAPLSEFSTKRAMEHVIEMAKAPHYVGSQNHETIATYLESELKKLGLETTTEQGTTLTGWGNLVKSKNIMARIKGSQNSKALVLLSHYDSAPHSASKGASDDAAGIAAILETVRAFQHNTTPHKNDIIILFTDAEELGLNGAAQFVMQSQWAKDVGLVLNCEARGTSGPSYMLMEVNNGNAAMVESFTDANPDYPVANSLMYSIYKMLPNDTDLTVFREQGKIQGFNFAFIDSHFNYHTAQDDASHLDLRSLEHQGSYLVPLLGHFGNTDLTKLNSDEDRVYFSTPVNFMSYPFYWNLPLVITSALLFIFLVFVGLGKRTLIPAEIGKGFLNLFGALLFAGLIGFFGWKIFLAIYPQYNDIQQGFTYNGHAYIFGFILLALSASFLFYFRPKTENVVMSQSVAPLLVWLLVNAGIALYLPGAGFFIIPVFCSLLMFGWFVVTQRTSTFFNLLFSIPALVIFVPFIWMFPIGLGLKILFGSMLLTVLVFSLLLPVFGLFSGKGGWSLVTFLAAIGFFVYANQHADYATGKAKPNSLVYVLDADKYKAYWATYDVNLDDWTKLNIGDNPTTADVLNADKLFSKYNSAFTYSGEAMVRDLPEPTIEFLRDSVINSQRYLKIRITPNRKTNRYDIFADEKTVFHNLKANGAKSTEQTKGSAFPRHGRKLLSYYVVNNEPLELEFSVNPTTPLDLSLMEASFDLMSNPLFDVKKRSTAMMPAPFVLNDAVILKKRIRPTPKLAKPVLLLPVPVPAAPVPAAMAIDTIPDLNDGN
jgi:hypothetical protein